MIAGEGTNYKNPVARRLRRVDGVGWAASGGIGLAWGLAGLSPPAWAAISEMLWNRSRIGNEWVQAVTYLGLACIAIGPLVGALLAGLASASDARIGAHALLRLTLLDGRRLVDGFIGAAAHRLRVVWALSLGSVLPLYGVLVLWLARTRSRVACRLILPAQCLPLERTLPRALREGAVMSLALAILVGGLLWLGVCAGTGLGLWLRRARWAALLSALLIAAVLGGALVWLAVTREARLSWAVRAWRIPLLAGLAAAAVGESTRRLAAWLWDRG